MSRSKIIRVRPTQTAPLAQRKVILATGAHPVMPVMKLEAYMAVHGVPHVVMPTQVRMMTTSILAIIPTLTLTTTITQIQLILPKAMRVIRLIHAKTVLAHGLAIGVRRTKHVTPRDRFMVALLEVFAPRPNPRKIPPARPRRRVPTVLLVRTCVTGVNTTMHVMPLEVDLVAHRVWTVTPTIAVDAPNQKNSKALFFPKFP